jgi:hypothetical protein
MRRGAALPPRPFLCLDPGETTGIAVFDGSELVRAWQARTKTPAELLQFKRRILVRSWSLLVYEGYRVYASKAEQHINSDVHTLRFIGMIETTAYEHQILLVKQMAGQVKGFFTDDKLQEWGFYQAAHRHANDAIRHGLYYLSFGLGKVRI